MNPTVKKINDLLRGTLLKHNSVMKNSDWYLDKWSSATNSLTPIRKAIENEIHPPSWYVPTILNLAQIAVKTREAEDIFRFLDTVFMAEQERCFKIATIPTGRIFLENWKRNDYEYCRLMFLHDGENTPSGAYKIQNVIDVGERLLKADPEDFKIKRTLLAAYINSFPDEKMMRPRQIASELLRDYPKKQKTYAIVSRMYYWFWLRTKKVEYTDQTVEMMKKSIEFNTQGHETKRFLEEFIAEMLRIRGKPNETLRWPKEIGYYI